MAQKKSSGRKTSKKKASPAKRVARAAELQSPEHSALKVQGEAIKQLLERARPVGGTPMMVGIRNISSYTLGIAGSPTPNEAEVQLAAALKGEGSGGYAIVSYAWYRNLRKTRFFKEGLITRDDSVLGPIDVPAPEDDARDIPTEHALNRVDDPTQWIESRSEKQIREAIKAMTSEPSLRRLIATVDNKVQEFREKLGCDGSVSDENKAKEEEAAMMLPSQYTLVERLVEQRLNELSPVKGI